MKSAHLSRSFPALAAAAALLLIPQTSGAAASYDGNRWFQVEISIFSNDYPEYRDAELWSPDRLDLGYPARTREFRRLVDFLRVDDFERRVLGETEQELPETGDDVALMDQDSDLPLLETGPFARRASADLRLPDFERDAWLLLPPGLSDFQTTNTRLERSPDNRLLFTGLWRQPVLHTENASALVVRGGRQFDQHHELEGSITIRFNENEDRVVIDTNLWLIDFTLAGNGDPAWQLPPLPPGAITEAAVTDFPGRTPGIRRIVQMRQSRDMRSNEYHYLDHPALGLVISVHPYDLPPPATLEIPFESVDLEDGSQPTAAPLPLQ